LFLLCGAAFFVFCSTNFATAVPFIFKVDSNDPPSKPPDFNYSKVVVIVAYDRSEYFEKCLRALISAQGSAAYTLIASVDGLRSDEPVSTVRGHAKILELLASVSDHGIFVRVLVDVSPTNLGVWKNKKRGISLAFDHSDFVVVLEDDILLSIDGLRWFEWHVHSGLIFTRKEIATASCWSASFALAQGPSTLAFDVSIIRELQLQHRWILSDWSHHWGWAIWRSTWEAFSSNWTGQDQNLALAIRASGQYESHPLVARCNNIGAFGTNKKGLHVGHVQARSCTSSDIIDMTRKSTECPPAEVKGTKLKLNLQEETHSLWPPNLMFARLGLKLHNVTESTNLDTVRQYANDAKVNATAFGELPCDT